MRQCGGCTLCCKLIPVEELGKPAGKRCRHQRTGKGCAIYAKRPWSCREWSCMWLIGTHENQPLDLPRPDRSHYVIDTVPDIVRVRNDETGESTQYDVMQIWVDPKFPDAWQDKALLDLLETGIIALIRYDSSNGFALCPPSRSGTGKWERSVRQEVSNEALRAAQLEARLKFWAQQAEEQG